MFRTIAFGLLSLSLTGCFVAASDGASGEGDGADTIDATPESTEVAGSSPAYETSDIPPFDEEESSPVTAEQARAPLTYDARCVVCEPKRVSEGAGRPEGR